MKKILFLLIVLAILCITGYFFVTAVLMGPTAQNVTTTKPQVTPGVPTDAETVLAEHLETPWAIAFLPTGGMLVTERAGRVRLIDANGELQEKAVAEIAKVNEIGEGGLLGIALHPEFATNNYVYLYYTYSAAGNNTLNRVVRMTLRNNTLVNEQILLDKIPGASNHNGGRIKFGPDGNLYIGTGDAQEPSQAQNTKSLAGKILRITDTGKPAAGNPFNNEVYSYGHRNVQGLAFDDSGQLWATEHGRSGATSGLDELNKIESGKNYGWPDIEGNKTRAGMVSPVLNSGATTTWAPAGAEIIGDTIYFGGLKGQALYMGEITGENVASVTPLLSGTYGRIREVIKGLDGMLYITTSNRDGRGKPVDSDDRVIRINPEKM